MMPKRLVPVVMRHKHLCKKLTTRYARRAGFPRIETIAHTDIPCTLQNMTLDDAHKLALKILKQVMEEQVNENNVQLAQVRMSVRTLA